MLPFVHLIVPMGHALWMFILCPNPHLTPSGNRAVTLSDRQLPPARAGTFSIILELTVQQAVDSFKGSMPTGMLLTGKQEKGP